MRVVNKNDNATNILTVNDLDAGEVFRFTGATDIYLMSDEFYIINIETGLILDTNKEEFEYKPIERINCHLVIE